MGAVLRLLAYRQAKIYTVPDYSVVDIYSVRGKVKKKTDGNSIAIAAMTLGISEVVTFPLAVAHSVSEMMSAKEIVLYYNDAGRCIGNVVFDDKGMRVLRGWY